MKKVQKKKGITLIALVITIVIMLLLAGVAIQMSLGENGIIVKSAQAKKEQAKAELYEVAKMEYLNLKTKALEKGEPNPEAEKILSETNFLNKYNVVGDNITDKKGEVIDTKVSFISTLKKDNNNKKVIDGVEIDEEDKDKMIFRLRVKEDGFNLLLGNVGIPLRGTTEIFPDYQIEVDYGDGTHGGIVYTQYGVNKIYNKGEYILKIANVTDFQIGVGYKSWDNHDLELIQWGKFREIKRDKDISDKHIFYLFNILKVHEPEPQGTLVEYRYERF